MKFKKKIYSYFLQENKLKYVICKVAAILFMPRCLKMIGDLQTTYSSTERATGPIFRVIIVDEHILYKLFYLFEFPNLKAS